MDLTDPKLPVPNIKLFDPLQQICHQRFMYDQSSPFISFDNLKSTLAFINTLFSVIFMSILLMSTKMISRKVTFKGMLRQNIEHFLEKSI